MSTLFAPYWLIKGIFTFINQERPDGILVSFSNTNSVNDHTGINTISNWMKRYGYWGLNLENTGKPLALSYPPLTYYLCRFLGVRGMFLFGQALFVFASTALLYHAHPALILLLPYIMVSPFYKNLTIACGRHDTAAFGIYVVALMLFAGGFPVYAMLLVIPLSLMHPAMCILGWMTLAIELASGAITGSSFAVVCTINFIVLLPWLYPYVSNLNVTRYLDHSWKPPGYKDTTRSLAISLKKTVPFLIFTLYFAIRYPKLEPTLLLCLPILFEINDYYRGSIMNRFSVDMLKLVIGMYCIASMPSALGIFLYIFLLYYYASPSTRKGFEPTEIYLKKNDFNRIKGFLSQMEGRKTLIISLSHDGETWRREAKYMDLCSMINSFKKRPAYMDWLHLNATEKIDPEIIASHAKSIGAEFVIFTCEPNFQLDFAQFTGSIGMPAVGNVPAVTLHAYKTTDSNSLVVPQTDLIFKKNTILLDVQKGVEYIVKLIKVRGWRGYMAGRSVTITGDQSGIRFKSSENGRFELRHAYRNYWTAP